MPAFRRLGVSISPQHCKNDAQRELSCENGSMNAKTRKYAEASRRMAASPPSHSGSRPLMSTPSRQSSPETQNAAASPCRTTLRASRSRPPPMQCATCTEKPAETA